MDSTIAAGAARPTDSPSLIILLAPLLVKLFGQRLIHPPIGGVGSGKRINDWWVISGLAQFRQAAEANSFSHIRGDEPRI
jgi:hypothetical protein